MGGSGIFSIDSILKYGILFICISVEGYIFLKNGNERRETSENYNNFKYYFIIITFLSLFASFKQVHFSFRTVQSFIFIFIPMLYSYLILNNWTFRQINFSMKIALFLSVIEYLFSIRMGFSQIISSLASINYNNTNASPLESSTFALLSLGFAAYFGYYKKNFLCKIVSLLFVIMTFKRVITLSGCILVILGILKIKNLRVNRFFLIVSTITLVSFSLIYYYSIQPQNILEISEKIGFSIRDFSTNRTDRLAWLSMTDFKSYGLGSTTDFMYKLWGVDLEMDIVQLILEVGAFGVIVFIYFYLRFSKSNLYAFSFMALLLLNSILSSGMMSTFSWIIILIAMSTIMEYKEGM
ncbi:hypothetical protein [Lactococcus lactis]|uniref:hypothetical protein n=1 Tax=Lactococcus lactis TaxID=1358 RepID=UPI0032194B8A